MFEKVSILQQFCSNKFDTTTIVFEQVSILQKVSSFTALVYNDGEIALKGIFYLRVIILIRNAVLTSAHGGIALDDLDNEPKDQSVPYEHYHSLDPALTVGLLVYRLLVCIG